MRSESCSPHHKVIIQLRSEPCFPVAYLISKVTYIKQNLYWYFFSVILSNLTKFNLLFLDFLFLVDFLRIYLEFQLLDFLLGHRHKALFHRAELKTLVYLHGHKVWIRFRATWCFFGLKQMHGSIIHKFVSSFTLEIEDLFSVLFIYFISMLQFTTFSSYLDRAR